MSSQQFGKYVIGIRREDKNRWERRAPLAPEHVKQLIAKGVTVLVQPSSLRTFSDKQYAEAGAIISEDLSSAQTIICVKEVPIEHLMPDKTYLFFSHTIKAQPQNMKMLDSILERKIRLIDYEKICDKEGKRLVRFGKFAGYAGMIDTLHATGDRLLALGHSTPFLHLGYSYCYSSLETAKQAVSAIGEEISNFGLPQDLVPMTFVFTSEGHVSQGAQEIFKLLPHEMVTPDEMVELVKHKEKASPYKVYGTVVCANHYAVPNDPTAKFDKTHYYAHPETYHSVFNEKYAPYVSVIVNCTYWDHRYCRLITIKQMKEATEKKNTRLLVVGDISCDRLGSIEFLLKTTSIDQPLFVYDPITGELYDSTTDKDYIYKSGILFCAVDNFPTEFPKEATKWFGDHLTPFLDQIAKSPVSTPFDQQLKELPMEISSAIVTSHGELTPAFKYIFDLRRENEKSTKTILILGAGYVAGCAVDYLARDPSNQLTVADIILSAAENIVKGKKNCSATSLDVKNMNSLEYLISRHNAVVCLLPSNFIPVVANVCLKLDKNLITASYIPESMKALHKDAKAKGLTFLNEIGLDPGIDHCEAKRVIDEVQAKGGEIKSFVSWCGGLPLPEFSRNPLGYKFSWSPRGVLTAATRDAKFLQDGKLKEVPAHSLFKHTQNVDIFPGFNLEGYPNRDSTQYMAEYGVKGAATFFRGTLRYTGWSNIMQAIADVGFLDETPQPHLAADAKDISWPDALKILLKQDPSFSAKRALKAKLSSFNGAPSNGYSADVVTKIVLAFKWFGLFEPNKKAAKVGNYLDSFCELLKEKLQYGKYEQDMILLHHIFEIVWPNGTKELKTSTLVVHGDKNGSAMGKTVGFPVAIATEMVLDGVVKGEGVIGPMLPQIYNPLLKALADEGIRFLETSSK